MFKKPKKTLIEVTDAPEALAFFKAIEAGDPGLIERALASGANPLALHKIKMALNGPAESKISRSTLSAISFAGSLAKPLSCLAPLVAAARKTESEPGQVDHKIGAAADWILVHFAESQSRRSRSDAWAYVDAPAAAERLKDYFGLMESGESAPWAKLGGQAPLSAAASQAVERFGAQPAAMSRALAGFATAGREDLCRLCFRQQGGAIDASDAIKVALEKGREALALSLNRSAIAWDIALGRFEAAERLLDGPERGWVNDPAPCEGALFPLGAAFLANNLPLAQKLLAAGANPNAAARSAEASAVMPLIAERACANDLAGVELLLLSKADPKWLNAVFKSSQMGSTTALGLAAFEGRLAMAEALLRWGASPKAIPPGALMAIAQKNPQARALLGKEGALSMFSRSLISAASRLAPAKPKAASANDQPMEPAFAPLSAGSASTLSLAAAEAGFAKANLPEAVAAKAQQALRMAKELAPESDLPAAPADQIDLRRLWEINMPRFLSRYSAFPEAERAAPRPDGEPSPLRQLAACVESAIDSMAAMRLAAMESAYHRLSAETAVMQANAERRSISQEGRSIALASFRQAHGQSPAAPLPSARAEPPSGP